MRHIIISISIVILAGCQSSHSEVETKYQGCVMLKSMTANDPYLKITLDCDAGKKACDSDLNSNACKEFLAAVTQK